MSRETIERLFMRSGITINGAEPWDFRVRNPQVFDRILADGSLGLGESYMDGWWECERVDEFVHRLIRGQVGQTGFAWQGFADKVKAVLFNPQTKIHAFFNAGHHYDIGNDLYRKMLDKRMIYSCAYWPSANSLDQAQENKLELICRKIGLKPGMTLLDIGCGWGGFAEYAAKRYHAEVTGITVSRNQWDLAKKRCGGLAVKILLQDYRDIRGSFDRVVSVGMFEHVGYKNYVRFLEVVRRCLKKEGLFLLHTIGSNASRVNIDPWIHRYIFPNAVLPSITQIGEASEGRFVMEDWHNLGSNYEKTLLVWYTNFERNWKHLKSRYSKRFYRMWSFYLLACAGAFRAREIQVWQILLSKYRRAIEKRIY